MKVLLVEQQGAKAYEYTYGAAKNYSDNYDITCYTTDDTPQDAENEKFRVVYGFHDIYTGSKIHKGLKYLKAMSELLKYIKREKFDIVHFQWYEIPIYEKFFFKVLKKLYTPTPKIVMTVHGIEPKEDGWFRHYGLQLMYKEADAICLHSEQALSFFNECFSVKRPQYMISSALFDENDYVIYDKMEARKKLNLPKDKIIILSFGTVRDDKSINLLFEAFPKAYEQNQNLFLLSGGTLNVSDKEYYLSLAETCIQTKSARIDFSYIAKDIEPLYYSAADILILPYSYISQSGVAYCGLIYSLPMIASDIPRLDLMARNGLNAEIFRKGEVKELADKIVSLSEDKDLLQKYSEGSKRILQMEFSIKRRVELTENVYRDIIGK